MRAITSALTWTATALLILAWVPLLGLIRLFDRDPARYRTGRWFRQLGAAITYVNPAWRIHEEARPPGLDPRAPYVVVSNHLSNADIPLISRLPWEMKWVAKSGLFGLPIVGWMMRWAGDIPVNRRDAKSRASVLPRAAFYLRHRCSVIFFPEGTRSKTGQMLRWADGPFRLAIREGVPILPLAVDGTSDALPKNDWKFGRADAIRLRVLEPVPTDGLAEADAADLRERVKRIVAKQVAEWRGVPLLDVLGEPPLLDAEPEPLPVEDRAKAAGRLDRGGGSV
jgi:1-acyl-sn-glycerol-3-phosphate acyltransferase